MRDNLTPLELMLCHWTSSLFKSTGGFVVDRRIHLLFFSELNIKNKYRLSYEKPGEFHQVT